MLNQQSESTPGKPGAYIHIQKLWVVEGVGRWHVGEKQKWHKVWFLEMTICFASPRGLECSRRDLVVSMIAQMYFCIFQDVCNYSYNHIK